MEHNRLAFVQRPASLTFLTRPYAGNCQLGNVRILRFVAEIDIRYGEVVGIGNFKVLIPRREYNFEIFGRVNPCIDLSVDYLKLLCESQELYVRTISCKPTHKSVIGSFGNVARAMEPKEFVAYQARRQKLLNRAEVTYRVLLILSKVVFSAFFDLGVAPMVFASIAQPGARGATTVMTTTCPITPLF